MTRILVTGGAGFIGSHTVERLLETGDYQVTILDDFNDYYDPAIKRQNIAAWEDHVKVVEGDLRDSCLIDDLFQKGEFDAVIHLAARAGVRPSLLEPELYLDVNIKGTFYLLEACRHFQVKHFVFASSSSVYGINKKVPFSEEDRLEKTISPYAMTKFSGEQLCANYSHLYGIRTVCLRFFTVYGPRQRPDLAISKFTALIDAGLPVPKYGDGATYRDYTYIEDIVTGIMGALAYDREDFSVFNLGGSQTVSLNEMIATIEEALGKTAQIDQHPLQPGDVPLTAADVTKAARLLGFRPQTAFREGIARYMEWYHRQENP